MSEDLFARFDHVQTLCLDEDPVSVLAAMREQCPVGWSQAHGGSWVLMRYEDIYSVARDPEVFSSRPHVSVPSHGMASLPPIEYDPPEHGLFRNPLISRFSPGFVAKSEPHIREVVTGLIDGFVDAGEADLVAQLTTPLPAIVNTPVLGIPVEDRDRFQKWAVALLTRDGDVATAAIQETMVYWGELFDTLRTNPRDDVPSLIVAVERDGERIGRDEFILTMNMLMAAGLDTTTNAGSHMLYYLGRNPVQRQELIDSPERIPRAVEELLRYVTPLPALFRNATRETTLHDKKVSVGDRVQLCWMAANHDPEEFPNPDVVDFDRPSNRHFAFGVGVHRCLGAALARLELRVLLEETLTRIPDYEILDEPERYPSVTRGMINLNVRFGHTQT